MFPDLNDIPSFACKYFWLVTWGVRRHTQQGPLALRGGVTTLPALYMHDLVEFLRNKYMCKLAQRIHLDIEKTLHSQSPIYYSCSHGTLDLPIDPQGTI